jgi:hypothetical protein
MIGENAQTCGHGSSSVKFRSLPSLVMAGLVAAIRVDPRDKPGDDELMGFSLAADF